VPNNYRKRPGPKPTGKTETILARVTPDLRQRLKSEANERGRALSAEIEERLKRSFDDPADQPHWGKSRTNYTFCVLIGELLSGLTYSLGACWINDPYVFQQAKEAVVALMDLLQPPGEQTLPDDVIDLRSPLFRSRYADKTDQEARKELEQIAWGLERVVILIEEIERHFGPRGEQELAWHKSFNVPETVMAFESRKKLLEPLVPKLRRCDMPRAIVDAEVRGRLRVGPTAYGPKTVKSINPIAEPSHTKRSRK
jgi:hypothetical protein